MIVYWSAQYVSRDIKYNHNSELYNVQSPLASCITHHTDICSIKAPKLESAKTLVRKSRRCNKRFVNFTQ